MMGNGRPLGKKQTVRLLVALTILAWATQTLFHQWGYGATVTPGVAEQFVPADLSAHPASLTLRTTATVIGEEVRLKQVCRWSDADAAIFDPIADLILFRLPTDHPYRALSMDELQRTLGNAGVNLAMIRFSGSMSCMVSRSDVNTNPEDGLRQWIAEHQAKRPPRAHPATRPIHAAGSVENVTVAPPKTPDRPRSADESQRVRVTTLREMLVEDLSRRLSLPVDSVQMRFNPEDRSTLDLSTPQFQFNIEPVRVYNLGDVIWNVTIIAGDSSKKVQIKAQAFAWRQQVVAVRPLSYRQMIRDEDVVSRRTLVNHLSDEPLLSLDQVVGQQAARQLKPGALFTASMVDAAPLVRMGQLVTVILSRGGIEIKTVGRAMENGAYGQTIRVRNERTRDVYQAVVSGQQTVRLGAVKATDQG